jgi:hypothetical protein
MIEKKVFDTRIILLSIPTTTMNFGDVLFATSNKTTCSKRKGFKIKSWQTSICPSG